MKSSTKFLIGVILALVSTVAAFVVLMNTLSYIATFWMIIGPILAVWNFTKYRRSKKDEEQKGAIQK